ncbi:hypothetical protein EsDP_00006137 [Epichloe bromicola]|uniref:Transcription factor domain-containing protein n=1 Tax=Epichloe bromicola TaxID=79588 RepID=A0ABQ0CWQ5_9HYPO
MSPSGVCSKQGSTKPAKRASACHSCVEARSKYTQSYSGIEEQGRKCPRRNVQSKVDELVERPTASGERPATNSSADITIPRLHQQDEDQMKTCTSASTDSNPPSPPSPTVSNAHNRANSSDSVCQPSRSAPSPPPQSDEMLLAIFRNELQPVYPFVVIGPHETAATLNVSKPFLMAAVRMASSLRNLQSMRAQMTSLMGQLTKTLLPQSVKSIDVLQGILIMAGWHHHHRHHRHHCTMHSRLSHLIAVAENLINEIGLSSPPTVPDRAWQQKRAAMGVWLLSSVMSTNHHKSPPMTFTPHMEQWLEELRIAGDAPTDRTLVFLVKIQRLTARICAFNPANHWLEDPTELQELQSELDGIQDELPDDMKSDCIIQTYLTTARLHLYQPPILDARLAASLSQAISCYSVQGLLALNKLDASRDALEAWLKTWFAIPIESLDRQNCLLAAHFIQALTMIGRWAGLTSSVGIEHCIAPLLYNNAIDEDDLPRDMEARQYSPLYGADRTAQDHGGAADRPTLGLSVPSILSALCNRFERASQMHRFVSSGNRDHDIWGLAIAKVRTARLKLQQREDESATTQAAAHKERGCRTTAPATLSSGLEAQYSYAQMYAHLETGSMFGADWQAGSLVEGGSSLDGFYTDSFGSC